MKNKIISCLIVIVAVLFSNPNSQLVANASAKPDKNVLSYVVAVNNSVRDVNTLLVQIDNTLNDIQNISDITGDYHTIDASENRLNADIKKINVNVHYNPIMAKNQMHIGKLLPTIDNDAQMIVLDLSEGIGFSLRDDSNSIIHHVNQMKVFYYDTYAEMKYYGIKPNLISIPKSFPTQIAQTPDSFTKAYIPPTQGLTPGFTYDNFGVIDSSFTLDDVNKLFGFDGALNSEVGAGTNYDLTTYTWQQGNASVVIMFQNGNENAKDQIGLQ